MARFLPLSVLLLSPLCAQTIDRPVRAVTDPGVVTTRQTITPAGVPTVFQGKVYGVTFGESAERLWVLSTTQLYEMDWRANHVLSNIAHGALPGLQGVSFHGKAYVTAVPRKKGAALFSAEGGKLQAVASEFGVNNTGAAGFGGKLAVVPLISENKVAVIDVSSGRVLGKVDTGIAPFAAVVNEAGTVAYVSNWGGRRPVAGDRTARTGLAPNADQVVVDSHGIASTGTITRIDLTTRTATHSLPAELHPNGLAWDEKGQRLYAANNNRDSITVIDTRTNTLVRHVPVQPFQKTVTGVAPTAVVLSPDGGRLYVACGGINAIAVLNTRSFALEGLIPTGWYPSALSLSADGKYLAVGSLLGAGSGWRDAPAKRFVHSYRGSVNVLPVPDAPQLASYTTAVGENNHLELKAAAAPARPVTQATPRAVPVRAGDPSLIQHVVYIVKENRTYDQVLGDLNKGNGDPSLTMFGKSVTPNQHRLADEFVVLDNFYASGGNSADGHQWVTQANEVAYTLYPGYEGRSYPFDGTDPIAIAQGGTIWDSALRLGKQVRIFGEYAGRRAEPASERAGYLRRWKEGEDLTSTFSATAPIEHMNAFLARNYPPYCISIPDVIRAQIFLKEFRQWESRGSMPHLTILQLPSNHTYGTSPGASAPSAMVADNDLALGQIVDALSHSQFWPKMAIFVVEDDAQNGVDHVDGHRTVALAISPYTRRGHIDSTFYSHQSMLKTMELMLGLPTLSLFDLIATEMRASFTDTADARPFTHTPATHDLFEVNPPLKALRGEARQAAQASAKMRWDVPDAAPTERLNRILWHSIRGWSTKYPGIRQSVFAPYSLDIDDDDR